MPRRLVVIAGAFVIAAALAAAVTAIYVNEGGERNAAAVASRSGAAPAADSGEAERLAAFVVHAEPRALAEVAFLAEDGTGRSLDDWKGRAVLLNLWATWCAPCRHEMPALDRLQAQLGGDGFEVVTVSTDRGGFDKPRAFFDEIGIEHLALYGDATSKVTSTLGVVGMPTTLLIDTQGREIGRLAGPAEWDDPAALAMIIRLAGLGS